MYTGRGTVRGEARSEGGGDTVRKKETRSHLAVVAQLLFDRFLICLRVDRLGGDGAPRAPHFEADAAAEAFEAAAAAEAQQPRRSSRAAASATAVSKALQHTCTLEDGAHTLLPSQRRAALACGELHAE